MSIIKNIIDKSSKQLKKDEHIKLVNKLSERLSNIEKMSDLKKTCAYNFRYEGKDTLWEPMLKDTIINYKKNCEQTMNNPMYDLIYRSRYSNNLSKVTSGFISIYNKLNQKVVMSDFIMFNKNYEINFLDVDRLLSYCKIKVIDNENYILDCWNYKSLGMYNCDYKVSNKKINFDMSNYYNIELVKTEEEKRLAVRALIQIMNEVPEEEINMHNYYTISEWYNYYDSQLVSYCQNESNIKINEDTILVGDICVQINKLLTKKEIFEILYKYAKYGSNDHYYMFGTNEKVNILDDIDNDNKINDILDNKINDILDNIKFNDATIETHISDEKIDLTKYLMHNGITRTNYVINEIEYVKKDRINCSIYKKNITPEELIVEIHNNAIPYNMGIFSNENKKLTINEATEILDKNKYIDYLNGIGYKLDFSIFPILNIKRCEDRNGNGFVIKCLNNIK